MAAKSTVGRDTPETLRNRASATALSGPLMCWMLVVNSAIKDKCRVWRGDLSVVLERAKVRGLWSVKMVKGRDVKPLVLAGVYNEYT